MNIPQELRYTKDHEWIRVDSEIAYVGITEFAQGELGEIVFIEVETVGETLAEADVFGTVEAVKTVSDMYMPVAGKVLALNPNLFEKPELVNQDPYGDGWIIKVEIENLADVAGLLTADEYAALIG